MLKVLSKERLNIPANRLVTKEGVVFDSTKPDRRVTYGELTQGKIIEKHLDAVPPLTAVSDFEIMDAS